MTTTRAPAWLRTHCYGTTTNPDKLTVVWEGKHLAVVKTPGGTSWTGVGSAGYYPVLHEVVEKSPTDESRRHTAIRVKGMRLELEGRPSKVSLEVLINAAKAADAEWPQLVAAERAAEEAKDRERAEEYAKEEREEAARQRLLKAAPHMLTLLKRLTQRTTQHEVVAITEEAALLITEIEKP